MKQKLIRKMSLASVMAAFAVVLNLISVRTDTSLYTIYALPLLLSGILYGPLVGLYSGLAAGIIIQLFTYGITPTTILWILAPTSWGLISGLISKLFKYKFSNFKIGINVFLSSIIVLFLNTLAQILDGLYYQYSTAFVWVNLFSRFIISIVVGIFYFVLLILILPRLTNIKTKKIKKEEVSTSPKIKIRVTIIKN